MANIVLNYEDITEIFKEKLKVNNIVKTISSVFQNRRYAEKIDYKPYFQRNYVWDSEKATYFIESIFLGTEIPPIVLFQTKSDKNEVIDGRQRYETIERFLNDRFALQENGLHCLKSLSGKKFSQLSTVLQEQFEETRIRILQFKVVNEPKLEDEKEDKIKKEIFRRYNSGIVPLGKEEIERAMYIGDSVSLAFYNHISSSEEDYHTSCKLFLPISKEKAERRDQLNVLMTRIRAMITLPRIPIYSYAHGSSKSDIIRHYYALKISKLDPEMLYEKYGVIIKLIEQTISKLEARDNLLSHNKLFNETLFWGFSILIDNDRIITCEKIDEIVYLLSSSCENEQLWARIINNPQRDISLIFDPTGSHYYSAINNRYNLIANILSMTFGFNFTPYLKDSESFKGTMAIEVPLQELQRYKLNKPLPETLTIDDIITDVQKQRFLIRPEYQRSEVTNKQKAAYLIESILLDINIPPIFIYKRADKVKEVVDGQQRLLTILGFLGKPYKDENGNMVTSKKDLFKLSKLKILDELNGKDINSLPPKYQDAIYEFPLDIIEIDADMNPEFNQTDLFARLNSKPYPIKENTFEMWNAYIDKEIVVKIRDLANEYQDVVFRAKDNRMKVEELIASLSYLNYRLSQDGVEYIHVLNIYKKNNRICARIMSKDMVTKTLNDISNSTPDVFMNSIESVREFAEKIKALTDHQPSKMRDLFSHFRKSTQYKTDQNFYLLWLLLYHIPLEKIEENKSAIFDQVREIFETIQNTPLNYNVTDFLKTAETFSSRF